MKGCKEYQDLIIDVAAGEATPSLEQYVREHLDLCPSCRTEYSMHERIFAQVAELEPQSDKIIEEIDWNDVSNRIHRNIRTHHVSDKRSPSSPFRHWKIMLPMAAALMMCGLLIGYFLFNSPEKILKINGAPTEGQITLARLETSLAKKEVSNFFKQTQLVFTDLMRQCDPEERVLWWNPLNKRRVKYLLERSRYFNQDLDNPHLLATRDTLKKIEWLLYEMITLEDQISCSRLQQLQEYIRQEKLLIKIRLQEKNLTISEV